MICFMMNLSRKHIWENKEEIGMDQVVITIARQYGSGGRTVGKMLAERLGISFYDKQIIQMASDESGIDVKLFGNSVLSTTFLFCLTKDYALARKSCYHLNCCSTVHHEVLFG